MTFTLGRFFPKPGVNEPFLALNDARWDSLEGGYKGSPCNAAALLKQLEQANNLGDAGAIYQELWGELHHQGDVGIASYYAVPHLVTIAKQKQLIDYNVLGLVSLIEIQRHKNNPPLPKALNPAYQNALLELAGLARLALDMQFDLSLATAAFAALALGKGQLKLAEAIFNLDSEDVIDEFLEDF